MLRTLVQLLIVCGMCGVTHAAEFDWAFQNVSGEAYLETEARLTIGSQSYYDDDRYPTTGKETWTTAGADWNAEDSSVTEQGHSSTAISSWGKSGNVNGYDASMGASASIYGIVDLAASPYAQGEALMTPYIKEYGEIIPTDYSEEILIYKVKADLELSAEAYIEGYDLKPDAPAHVYVMFGDFPTASTMLLATWDPDEGNNGEWSIRYIKCSVVNGQNSLGNTVTTTRSGFEGIEGFKVPHEHISSIWVASEYQIAVNGSETEATVFTTNYYGAEEATHWHTVTGKIEITQVEVD